MNLVNLFRRSPTELAFDSHTEPHYDVTAGQLSFTLIWACCSILWLFRCTGKNNRESNGNRSENGKVSGVNGDAVSVSEKEKLLTLEDKSGQQITDSVANKPKNDQVVDVEKGTNIVATNEGNSGNTEKQSDVKTFSTVRPPPTTELFLKHVCLFGLLLFFFYLCDYRKVFPKLERIYNRDEFLFLVFLLFLVACAFTIRPTTDKILNRDQTEEWKGWMQVMFVWYHVFAAKEWYNWIRVYIAAYVWMTGFGNFSFFWVRKDFSLWRFLKMQFRLNFLVTCICVVTSNQYMLYYICAMHSYWFISVYVFMGVLKSWNTDSKKMALKFVAYFIFNSIIFEIPVVTNNIFKPFQFLLGYTEPEYKAMHEWAFRAGLDHWACFFGMLCAYNYPTFERFMNNLEKSDDWKKIIWTKCAMVNVCIIALLVWYKEVMGREKYAYNALHPYTTPIPIVCFIIIRNAFPAWRTHYVELFAWLGKITLETYLSQLHIYLQSNAKHFIGYIPNYHFLNFALATLIYLPVSYALFNLTTEFSSYLLPNNLKVIAKNAVYIALAFLVPYVGFTILLAFY
ncbi:uncharacterized protein LOC123540969 [Mercenaria mercenaria]|uniref:uncharacterized protein LOC123540969 n=1 Tax=Mercenaria mercenaria TaxID=6596 RepID=UPI00234F42E6|nr:uncharacterized protein LOC123540969 [Mercenaria mercenaria]XP_045182243.2 uncharacterized protein LOC123540969 [Mercenaria mercenaria]